MTLRLQCGVRMTKVVAILNPLYTFSLDHTEVLQKDGRSHLRTLSPQHRGHQAQEASSTTLLGKVGHIHSPASPLA